MWPGSDESKDCQQLKKEQRWNRGRNDWELKNKTDLKQGWINYHDFSQKRFPSYSQNSRHRLFSCLKWFRCWGGKLRLCHLWTSFTIYEEASFIITFLRRKTILEAWHFFSTTFVSMGIVKKVMEENRVSAFLYPAQHKPHGSEETGCWAEGLSPSFNSDSNRRQQEMQPYIIFSVRDSGNYIYGESGEEAGHSIPNFLQIFDLRERKGSAFRSGPCFRNAGANKRAESPGSAGSMGNCTLSRWSAGSEQKYLRGRWFLLGCDHALYEFWYCSSPRDNSVLWVYQLAKNSFDLKSVWFLLSISVLSESWYCSEPLQMCQMPLLVTVVKYMMELSFTIHFLLVRVSARKQ